MLEAGRGYACAADPFPAAVPGSPPAQLQQRLARGLVVVTPPPKKL